MELYESFLYGYAPHAPPDQISWKSPVFAPEGDKEYTISYIKKYLRGVLRKCEIDPNEVVQILEKGGPEEGKAEPFDYFTSSLINSDTDLDRTDYLVRDAHFTGIPTGQMNIRALIDEIIPYYEDGKYLITYTKKVIPYLDNFIYAHARMYSNCYEENCKVGCERYLLKCIKKLLNSTNLRQDDLMLLTDEQLLCLIMLYAEEKSEIWYLIKTALSPREFELIYELSGIDVEKKGSAKTNDYISTVSGYSARPYIEQAELWEKTLADKAKMTEDNWKIAVSLPAPEGIANRGFTARILVQEENEWHTKEATEIDKRLEKLFRFLYLDRLKYRVYVHKSVSKQKRKEIRKAAKNLFEK